MSKDLSEVVEYRCATCGELLTEVKKTQMVTGVRSIHLEPCWSCVEDAYEEGLDEGWEKGSDY